MRDATELCEDERTGSPARRSPDLLEFRETELTVEDIMTEAIVSAMPQETISSATQRMSEYDISCIPVMDGERAVGILTERDVLRDVATGREDFGGATVAEEMSSPVISVPPDLPALEAGGLMESRGIKRLLVVRGERLVGVVTQTDITQSLISMCRFKNISELMTTEVVMVSATTTITEAARLMASRNISCVVLLHRTEAAGIVTERDILQRVVARGEDPTATPVAEIMSFPVVTVPSAYSVMSASRKMHEMHIHRLLVGSAKHVEGIVTQTDIIAAVRRKLEEARQARAHRRSEMTQLVDQAVRKLSAIQDLAGGPGAPAESRSLISELQDRLERLMTMIQDSD